MSKTLHQLIPDADTLLALQPEELAGVLMEYFNGLPPNERWSLSRHNFFHNPAQTFSEYPAERQEQISQGFVEAWVWLEREGLLIPKIGGGELHDGRRRSNGGTTAPRLLSRSSAVDLQACRSRVSSLPCAHSCGRRRARLRSRSRLAAAPKIDAVHSRP